MDKKRYYEIDNMYALGTILVVLGHSHPSDWARFSGTYYEKLITFIYLFHMPLFFFIAGFLMYNSKAMKSTKFTGYFTWIGDKAVKLLVPYIVLQAIALVPKYYLENHSFSGIEKSIGRAIMYPKEAVWGHLWFLPVLLLIYAVWGIGFYYSGKFKNKYVLLAVVIATILHFVKCDNAFLGINEVMKYSVFFSTGLLMGLIYEAHGTNKHKKASGAILFILFTATALALYKKCLSGEEITLAIAALMILSCMCFAVFIGSRKIFRRISDNNYTIYLYSWIIQSAVMYACNRLGIGVTAMCICMFVAGFAGPVLVIYIYRRQKILKGRVADTLLGIKNTGYGLHNSGR